MGARCVGARCVGARCVGGQVCGGQVCGGRVCGDHSQRVLVWEAVGKGMRKPLFQRDRDGPTL